LPDGDLHPARYAELARRDNVTAQPPVVRPVGCSAECTPDMGMD
jgi:hypothetical protein